METAMEASPVLFDFARPSKKRNYIRRRDDGKDETTENITSITPSSIAPPAPVGESLTANFAQSTTSIKPSSQDSEGEQGLGLAEILRRRKNIARPKKGLDIAEIVPKVARDAKTEKPKSEEKAVKNTTEQELAAVVNRFTHQTGQVMDVDKHMVAYIESEMEKRRRAKAGADSSNTSQQSHPSSSSQSSGRDASKNAFWQPTRPADRGATLGKLHEVDLGEENKIRNITRTKEATRRLEGGGEPMEDVQMDGKAGKKSYRRRRRNSQDIQRDKLVEEVLKESKLELYDEPQEGDGEEEEGAADDRIAEKFRREFLDALMSRRRRRGNYQNKKKRDDGKKPRGPKLGGSRSARAAMRESQLAQNGGVKK